MPANAQQRIAIVGGGLSGLTAAFELEKARQAGASLDWQLYEASDRLGGILETTRIASPEGEYILEGGPDGWVTEKPWARELALELGLGDDLIYSNDATRRTYIYIDGELQAIPDGMRLMVPEDLRALEGSPLFSTDAKQAYANELADAEELKSTSPLLEAGHDESVASFVFRHFGQEVLDKLAAPLLSGVFGGDVHELSVRSVMPQFVRMEREHGSLILALQQAKRERGGRPQQPIFTSLRRGMSSLVEALVAKLPAEKLHLNTVVQDVGDENRWCVVVDELERHPSSHPKPLHADWFDQIVVAVPLNAARGLLRLDGDHRLRELLPTQASSALLASFTWPAECTTPFALPQGFGLLAARSSSSKVCHSEHSEGPVVLPTSRRDITTPQLLACTFVDQKFPHRAPAGARILRAFFGSDAAEHLTSADDQTIAHEAFHQLAAILGPLPQPEHTVVRRWPRSLPQYETGHLGRMAQLDQFAADVPGLTLLGNSYRGVGIPDLIRDARNAARRIVLKAQQNT